MSKIRWGEDAGSQPLATRPLAGGPSVAMALATTTQDRRVPGGTPLDQPVLSRQETHRSRPVPLHAGPTNPPSIRQGGASETRGSRHRMPGAGQPWGLRGGGGGAHMYHLCPDHIGTHNPKHKGLG